MKATEWWRRRRGQVAGQTQSDAAPNPPTVDPETGEIQAAPAEAAPPSRIPGERSIPSVNRARSVQARVRNALAFGLVALMVLVVLVWYYASHFAAVGSARDAARQAAEARNAGEMRVPPLGRVDPPKPPAPQADTAAVVTTRVTSELYGAPPPLPPPAPTPAPGTGGPPTKTPAQLALERRLGEPVLWRATPTAPRSVQRAADATAPAGADDTPPSTFGSPTPLAGLLRPTVTPATRAQVLPTMRWLLPKGAFIDCTLETAIDSTFDGMVTCIGATDIYSADGRVVLLERGTKYVGEKRGELRQGQGRVFVLWNEARTPTGVVVSLASPGTDELGRTGLPGYVDTHFWDRFGAALLVSVIDGVVQALANSGGSDGGGNAVVFNPRGGRDIVTEVLKDTIAIPPTVVKNQGDRIQVLVARDVDFRSVYALGTDAGGR
jgi:type IV secretion system protein VirB10